MSTGTTVETVRDGARRLFARDIANGCAPAGLHCYTDAQGEPQFYRARLKHPNGKKVIRPIHLSGARWKVGEPPAPAAGKPLYRLAELQSADPASPVFVVEGEACVDSLVALGLIATTSGGASSGAGADWTSMRGRRCLAWPDNDGPGRKYVAEVATRLRALDCAVDVVDVAALGLSERGDCVDWLAAHPDATAADVLALPRMPSHSHGDGGDTGDALCSKGPSVPTLSPSSGAVGTNGVGRFELKQGRNGQQAGTYWIGHERDRDTGEDLERPPEWICSPLEVIASTRDERGNEWGRLLLFADRDERPHRWAMPMTMLATDGAELRTELLRQGLEVSTLPGARRRLLDYVQGARPEVTARCVTRTGWHGEAYVLPTRVFNDTAEPIIYQAATLEGVELAQGGTLEGWRTNVAQRCAGHSRLVLALSAGFAGPCLGLLGAEGGGFHLRGGSSQGKSTALFAAGSIYGPPSFVRTWRATDNALEGVAALHSDMLLPLDELGQLEPRDAGKVAYMLANGQGKGRANRYGGARATPRWRLLFLSSGELGMGDLIAQAGQRIHAGQEVRVIDIPADAGKGYGLLDYVPEGCTAARFAEELKAATATHYGHAMPAFVRALTADVEGHRALLLEMRDAMARKLIGDRTEGQVCRVAARFALLAAAGALASDVGLTGWDGEESERAVEVCFQAWMEARGTTGDVEPIRMVEQVRAFIEAHGESRFSPTNAGPDAPRTINRVGYRRETPDGPEYLVFAEAFKREVCKGFDPAAVAKALERAGALVRGGDGRVTQKVRLPDKGGARVYVITPAIQGGAP